VAGAVEKRRNWATWWGFLLALGAVLANVIFFVNLPIRHAVPWLSLLLALIALIFVVRGVLLAFGHPQIYRGKVLTSIISVVSLLLAGFTIFVFVHARELPVSASAPQVGQKVPEFTLADTSGQPVSLDQLFAAGANDLQASPPRAVLLIFYRGYW
jgi:hypothetical protein